MCAVIHKIQSGTYACTMDSEWNVNKIFGLCVEAACQDEERPTAVYKRKRTMCAWK